VCLDFTAVSLIHLAPGVVQHLLDGVSLGNVPVEHSPDEIDAFVADCVRHAQVTVHYLIDAVEWVLLVHDGVQEDAQRPNILLLASVWLAG
jgi:hypothetical protein